MKKVLILSGSPRKGGNSDILCGEFARGAVDAGNEAETIRVAEKKIAPCSGCYYCTKSGGACAHRARGWRETRRSNGEGIQLKQEGMKK